jgi:hypothetical protein
VSKLSPETLDAVVRQQLGSGESWRRIQLNNSRYPMRATLTTATAACDRDFVVYRVSGGLPLNFSMPGLDPAPIFYNTRFIEFCFTLLSLLHDTALPPELTINVADATFTQVVAELVMRNGDPSTAAYLFAYSLAIDIGHMYVKPSMEDFELSEPTEANMALWFYGLLHEIGHVRSTSRRDAAALREHVNAVLPDTLARLDLNEEIINSEIHRLDREGIRHSMLPDHLLTEAAADHFATIALWNATIDVLTSRGQGLKPLERPWLTVIEDDYSRAIAGYAVNLGPACAAPAPRPGAATARGSASGPGQRARPGPGRPIRMPGNGPATAATSDAGSRTARPHGSAGRHPRGGPARPATGDALPRGPPR